MDKIKEIRKNIRELNTTINNTRNIVQLMDEQLRDIIETESSNIINSSFSLFDEWWDENIIVTSNGIGNWQEFPESLVILGAGVIGCEFATIFSNIGKTKVYLIDKGDRILPFEDEDVAKMVTENLEANGVTIHKNSSLVRMEIKENQVEYELQYTDGRTEILHVQKALVSHNNTLPS